MKIERAVVSVSDKSGLGELGSFLKEHGVEIMSTGGTKKFLDGQGIPTIDIGTYTGFPEIMDGRVKTLHPKVAGGILAIREKEEHVQAMKTHGIKRIDLIVVNLYPFREVIAKGCTFEDAIENIDIGGPSMIRAAAKNFKYVNVVIDAGDYPKLMEEMKAGNGDTSLEFRYYLAKKVYQTTSEYDKAIYSYLSQTKP
jgi:phosphoribosylaminoimidazolecarboxamide formyltransferase / IMP cyclohydrolase